jgi:diacylglycerol kinase
MKTNSFKELLLSFRHAFRGFTYAFKTQRNLRIEAIIAIFVVVFGIVLGLGVIDWILVFSSIIFVIVSELFNTSIEALADVVNGKHDIRIKNTKDMAAASVFLTVSISAIIGILVFGQRILILIKK